MLMKSRRCASIHCAVLAEHGSVAQSVLQRHLHLPASLCVGIAWQALASRSAVFQESIFFSPTPANTAGISTAS